MPPAGMLLAEGGYRIVFGDRQQGLSFALGAAPIVGGLVSSWGAIFLLGGGFRPSVGCALAPRMLLELGLSASLLWSPFSSREGANLFPLTGLSLGLVF